MNRGYVAWAKVVGQDEWTALMHDADGLAWEATIRSDLAGVSHSRLRATLLCREAGLYKSNNRLATLEHAQRWCYEALGLPGAQT